MEKPDLQSLSRANEAAHRCVYPQCDGAVSFKDGAVYCSTCRRPLRMCESCGGWNRSQAAFCRTCGKRLNVAEDRLLPDAETLLSAAPLHTRVEEAIRTLPQAQGGFLWAMGEQGNLYRINPHDREGRSPEVCTRFWAKPAAHAFTICDLERSPGSELVEAFAVVATAERLVAWGIVTHATRVFEALQPGEAILADARDSYQLVAAAKASAYCLTRAGSLYSLLEIDLSQTGNPPLPHVVRHLVQDGPVCGPAVVHDRVVAWNARGILTLTAGAIERQALPPGVELWTAPAEDSALRLPLGRTPCMIAGASFYLPCSHYGAPALLRAQSVSTGWSLSAIPVPNGSGTLSQDVEGNPLLASGGRLYRCLGASFQELAADEQLSSRFAAFHGQDLSVYFCEGEYGVRSHGWLQASSDSAQQRVNWSLDATQTLKECSGFWMISGALVAQLLIEDRQTITEFVSWRG